MKPPTEAQNNYDNSILMLFAVTFAAFGLYKFYDSISLVGKFLLLSLLLAAFLIFALIFREYFSKSGKEKQKQIKQIREIPSSLLLHAPDGIYIGHSLDLDIPIYLPDQLRSRHVHILGATGTGKTESVILNFLRQDITRGLGSIILDAKGDASFLSSLKQWVPEDRLKIFDLCDENGFCYNPMDAGTPLEAAQRLFSSLKWSEEYYASKARCALQVIFQKHFEMKKINPTLREICIYLETPAAYTGVAVSPSYPSKLAAEDYACLTGLRDQITSLCTGHLAKILSPTDRPTVNLSEATTGSVLYFRLQSMMSPQVASTVGKLLINHLNFFAGTAHRVDIKSADATTKKNRLIPTYLDEFATFACPEFAELIAKARSAGLALHFSHQSIGDLTEVSPGFINRVTDNSATKIVLRISDPDSADFFSRSFGTKLIQKLTQRVTNSKEQENAEILGEGSLREARQFRASPDLLKTLPTGVGSVLIAHGIDTPHGASDVFKIKFPRLI